MRIIVTGASGFVGRRLTPALAAAHPEAEIRAWTHGDPTHAENSRAGSEAIDLRDEAAVARGIASFGPDVVFHLAALSSVGQSAEAQEETWSANLGGTWSLASAMAHNAPGARLVFASTGEVYGDAFAAGEVDESTAPMPANPYARSKLAAEMLLHDVLAPISPVIALRFLNHTGPGQDERFVAPAFAAQIARIEARLVPPRLSVGNLSAERDFLDVDDAIDAYLAAMRMDVAPAGFTVWNVASSMPRSIASVLDRLVALAQIRFDIVEDPARMRPSDIARTAVDTSAFRGKTGWAPHRDIDATLANLLDHWRQRVAAERH